jgi:hypothetical protein
VTHNHTDTPIQSVRLAVLPERNVLQNCAAVLILETEMKVEKVGLMVDTFFNQM